MIRDQVKSPTTYANGRDGSQERPVVKPPNRPATRLRVLVGALALLVLATAGAAFLLSSSAPPSPPQESAVPIARLTARGQVRPAAQSRIGTLMGGVVVSLSAQVGDTIREQQEVARVRGVAETEIVTSPRSGTVMNVLVNVGDTLAPGAIAVTVGDLSVLQVETRDVDEFLVSHVSRGQPVRVQVDALDREVRGRVRSVALQSLLSPDGDDHYPVVIDLDERPSGLRPGMTVRVDFAQIDERRAQ